MNDTGERVNKWVELSEKAFNFACYARYWLKEDSLERKREVLYGIGSNVQIMNKFLRVTLEEPLEYIGKAKEEVEEISPEFEPTKKGLTETQMYDFYSQNPSMLRD